MVCVVCARENNLHASEFVLSVVLAVSPSRGGDVAVYIFCRNQPMFLTPFYLALVSISVVMTLSTVFHSINSPDNFPFCYSVPPV